MGLQPTTNPRVCQERIPNVMLFLSLYLLFFTFSVYCTFDLVKQSMVAFKASHPGYGNALALCAIIPFGVSCAMIITPIHLYFFS